MQNRTWSNLITAQHQQSIKGTRRKGKKNRRESEEAIKNSHLQTSRKQRQPKANTKKVPRRCKPATTSRSAPLLKNRTGRLSTEEISKFTHDNHRRRRTSTNWNVQVAKTVSPWIHIVIVEESIVGDNGQFPIVLVQCVTISKCKCLIFQC